MRRTTIGILAVTTALTVAGCGSAGTFANKPKPPAPVDLTVYINNARVSLSPSTVGAGPVIFIITNQANSAQSLSILPAGASAAQPLANTGPINPQGTAQVSVNFPSSGDYTLTTAGSGQTDAQLATAPSIAPAKLHIGGPRPSASNVLLQP
jgi:hypothetical protein